MTQLKVNVARLTFLARGAQRNPKLCNARQTCWLSRKGAAYRVPQRRNNAIRSSIIPMARAFGADDFGTKADPPVRIVQQKQPSTQNTSYSGVFWLLLVNFALFLADHVLHLPWVSSLYLYHGSPRWWQYLTSAFCHGSWQHLSSNAFMLYVFGRIVEEEEGTIGVWATYCLCALGASIASLLMQPPNVISLGASGAVFGLFTVSVLLKLSFNFRKLLECLILGQFVFQQLISEAKLQSQVWAGGKGLMIAGTQVGHLAHLAGALAGVLLVLLLSRLPAAADK